MPKDRNIKQESFDAILMWLDRDRETAALKYEELRRSLIKILGWHSCVDAAGLADEVFNRVACKVEGLIGVYQGDPRLYFYAVANNLVKEQHKQNKVHVSIDDVDLPANESLEDDLNDEAKTRSLECFRECLQQLSPENRALVVDYYQKEKQAKIDHRKQIAARLGIELNALRVKMHRMRVGLEECIERCIGD
jgi:DNA-directed RNA polymerase specialized sigma24 family protein